MPDEAKKTQHEAERAAQAKRERGAMPMEEQGAEVAGHAQTMAQQPTEPGATATQNRRPEAEEQARQREMPLQGEQAI